MGTKTFLVTEEHIKLLKRTYIEDWDDTPCVDRKRPYGNSNIIGDIADILGFEKTETIPYQDDRECSEDVFDRCKEIHSEMTTVFQILVSNPTSFNIGLYEKTDQYDSTSWRIVISMNNERQIYASKCHPDSLVILEGMRVINGFWTMTEGDKIQYALLGTAPAGEDYVDVIEKAKVLYADKIERMKNGK